MDSESKELLEESVELSKENNKMLQKIRGIQKREFIWRALKIVAIIALALGAYYYIEPYLNKVVNVYNSIIGIQQDIKSTADSVKNVTNVPNNLIQDLLKKI